MEEWMNFFEGLKKLLIKAELELVIELVTITSGAQAELGPTLLRSLNTVVDEKFIYMLCIGIEV